MARKKLEILEDENLDEQPSRTRPVKVSTVTREEYIREEPEEATTTFEVTEDSPPDIFSSFNEIVSSDQTALLRIWRLPNYDIDGRSAIAGTEREYCGSVPYHADNAVLLDQISGRVPMGGMVQLELFANSAVRKRGLLKLMKQAMPNPNYSNGQQGTRVIIQNPEAAPAAKPFDGVREAFGLLRDMGETMKAVLPAPTAQVVAQVEAPEPLNLKDRLLEGVILKMVESPKADSLERVADLLTGGKETSWVDSLIQGFAPHAGPFLNQIGSGLNMLLMRVATGAPVEANAGPIQASSSGVIPDSGALPESPTDPAEHAWRRVLSRILDDLFEHVACIAQARAPIDVHSSAESVVDLAARFENNEQITLTVEQLLAAPPDQVIAMCAMMVPPAIQERVGALAQNQAAILWVIELQVETRAILADNGGDNNQVEGATTNDGEREGSERE